MNSSMGASSSMASGEQEASRRAGMTISNTEEHLAIFQRERKKKVTGFATLRKKFIRRRRSSKTCDHARVIRELVSDWSPLEIGCLLEEYEALAALKDLCVQAELARPPAATYKQDLSALYDFKCCTDIDLIFRGACFPVHRALLSVRCPYFRELLTGCPGHGARIGLELRTPGVDVSTFSVLLRYLYTGDIKPEDGVDISVLRQLGEEFGLPAPLERDLRTLLVTGDYADAALVFTNGDSHRPEYACSEYGFRPKVELPCHKAILSARSPFFRNIIQRRTRSGEEHTEHTLNMLTRIELDESVIPRRYATLLLHVIYLDTVDLSLILRASWASLLSISDTPALPRQSPRLSVLEEAMELYQIGRFLELDILAQGCEDIILKGLTIDSLPCVLKWGSQPHGSAWVKRQALRFLREEFQTITGGPVLYQLEKSHLLEALQSSFLQASELEVLQTVLKWGEQRLVRRMEDREPNLLSHTAHSVAKKGVKKRDLSDVELREILSDLLQHVRMDHVLPPNSDVLTQAIRRRLVSTPPTHMIGGDRESLRVNAWIRSGKNNGLYVRPRLFMPYYEEIKAIFEDQMLHQNELLRLRRSRYVADIPDTLYMVEDKPRTMGVDVLAAAISVPDPGTMAAMVRREQKVRSSPCVQRALSLPLSSRREINRQVRLRVVREFNLPDQVADLLENAACYCAESEDIEPCAPSSSRSSASSHPCFSVHQNSVREHIFRPSLEPESSSCSDGHLSDVMPDVAMATSTLGQLQLQEQELELDLGDGTPHTSTPARPRLPNCSRQPYRSVINLSRSNKLGFSFRQEGRYMFRDEYPTCAYGTYQTPIHIQAHLVEKTVMPGLDFNGYYNFLAPPLRLSNNGYTVKLTQGSYKEGSLYNTPYISGSFLVGNYIWDSLHFHWGMDNDRGSEHVIENLRYPMEMHIVHRKSNYSSYSEAIKYKDGLVVLAFFYQLRVKDNRRYRAIIQKLEKISANGSFTHLDKSFPLVSILPRHKEFFYIYEGSLTSPPCSEVVTWILFPDPIPLSFRQMQEFRLLQIKENFRRLQPVGQRKIYFRSGDRFVRPHFTEYLKKNISSRLFWLRSSLL